MVKIEVTKGGLIKEGCLNLGDIECNRIFGITSFSIIISSGPDQLLVHSWERDKAKE